MCVRGREAIGKDENDKAEGRDGMAMHVRNRFRFEYVIGIPYTNRLRRKRKQISN